MYLSQNKPGIDNEKGSQYQGNTNGVTGGIAENIDRILSIEDVLIPKDFAQLNPDKLREFVESIIKIPFYRNAPTISVLEAHLLEKFVKFINLKEGFELISALEIPLNNPDLAVKTITPDLLSLVAGIVLEKYYDNFFGSSFKRIEEVRGRFPDHIPAIMEAIRAQARVRDITKFNVKGKIFKVGDINEDTSGLDSVFLN